LDRLNAELLYDAVAGGDFAAGGELAGALPIKSNRSFPPEFVAAGAGFAAGEVEEKKSPKPLFELNPLCGAAGCAGLACIGGGAGESKKDPPPPKDVVVVAFGAAAGDFTEGILRPANGDGLGGC